MSRESRLFCEKLWESAKWYQLIYHGKPDRFKFLEMVMADTPRRRHLSRSGLSTVVRRLGEPFSRRFIFSLRTGRQSLLATNVP